MLGEVHFETHSGSARIQPRSSRIRIWTFFAAFWMHLARSVIGTFKNSQDRHNTGEKSGHETVRTGTTRHMSRSAKVLMEGWSGYPSSRSSKRHEIPLRTANGAGWP